jgi:hypothetical protein
MKKLKLAVETGQVHSPHMIPIRTMEDQEKRRHMKANNGTNDC